MFEALDLEINEEFTGERGFRTVSCAFDAL